MAHFSIHAHTASEVIVDTELGQRAYDIIAFHGKVGVVTKSGVLFASGSNRNEALDNAKSYWLESAANEEVLANVN